MTIIPVNVNNICQTILWIFLDSKKIQHSEHIEWLEPHHYTAINNDLIQPIYDTLAIDKWYSDVWSSQLLDNHLHSIVIIRGDMLAA